MGNFTEEETAETKSISKQPSKKLGTSSPSSVMSYSMGDNDSAMFQFMANSNSFPKERNVMQLMANSSSTQTKSNIKKKESFESEENKGSEANEVGLESPKIGHIPNIVTPSGSGFWKGTEEMSEAVSISNKEGKGNVVADINLNFTQTRNNNIISQKNDPVVSGVTIGTFSQPGGKPVSPFGEESFEPAFENITHAFNSSKCVIKADLDINCPWGTNSGGRINVPSATDAVITKSNYIDIKNDLTPSATTPHKSPRTKYYSQALVEKHEKFHGTDDYGWVKSSGLPIVKATLEAGNISSGIASATEVSKLVEKSRIKLVNENFKWYKGGGTSHGSYAGEIRAYADGKAAYKKLAEDVEKHGKTL